MSDGDLELRIRTFVSEHLCLPVGRFGSETDVVRESGIDGDDICELVGEFGKEFHVDVSGYRWYHHGGPEGCNPLWLIFRPWWMKKTYVPMRISDLVESARQGVWTIQYPENERRR